MAYQVKRLGDVVVDIHRAIEWYKSLRINIDNTRLDDIYKHVALGLMNPSTEEGESFNKGIVQEIDYYALNDGSAFGLIASEFSKLTQNTIPKRTLRDVLNGPLTLKKENLSNNDARNKFVELELAANLSSAGIEILGFDDVYFEFENIRYLCECKRPFKESTLDSNIEKAYSQLTKKLKSKKDRGLIAIAVEKIFNLDQSFKIANSPNDISEYTLKIANEFKKKVSKYQTKWVDTRIVGILAIIRFLIKTQKIAGPSYNIATIVLPSPSFCQKSDHDKLLRLSDYLKSKF